MLPCNKTQAVTALLSSLLLGCAAQDIESANDTESVDELSAAAGVTTRLQSLSCGTWDSSGAHATGNYFIGHSQERPNETVAYFIFDFTPIKGRTVTAANITIPGTNDWHITAPWPNHTPLLQFKIGARPLPSQYTLADVTNGNHIPLLFHYVSRSQDLGYDWKPSASTTNTYDSFHYNTDRLQQIVNAGGRAPIFAASGWGTTISTEEYIYGGSHCTSAVTFNVTVQ